MDQQALIAELQKQNETLRKKANLLNEQYDFFTKKLRDASEVIKDTEMNYNHASKLAAERVKEATKGISILQEQNAKQQESSNVLYHLFLEEEKIRRSKIDLEKSLIEDLNKHRKQQLAANASQEDIDKARNDVERRMTARVSRITNLTKAYETRMDQLQQSLAGLSNNNIKDKIERENIQAQIDNLAKQKDIWTAQQEAMTDQLAKISSASEGYKNAATQLQGYQPAIQQAQANYATASLNGSNVISKFTTKVWPATASLEEMAKALGRITAVVGKQIGSYSGVISATDVFRDHWEALIRGVKPEEFTAILAQNRQLTNSLGGVTATNKIAGDAYNALLVRTGNDTKLATELVLKQMTSFATQGVKPTQQTLQAWNRDLGVLQVQTGMNAQQSAEYYRSITDDIDVTAQLRMARVDEREAILKNQRALVQMSIAAGQTAEQAKNAAKLLNSMVAAKPIDRIKQAAKTRALAGALGVSGGDEAAQALIAGGRASPEQKKFLQEFSQRLTNAGDTFRGQGLGSEIFATVLADKLNLGEQYGQNSSFSTTLGNLVKMPIEKVETQLKNNDLTQSKIVTTLFEILAVVKGIGSSVLGDILTSVAVLFGLLKTGKLLAGLAGRSFGSVLGASGTTAAASAGGAVAGTAGAGVAATVGTIAAAAVGAAGAGQAIWNTLNGKGGQNFINDAAESVLNGLFGGGISDVIDRVTGLKSKNDALTAPTPLSLKRSTATEETANAIKDKLDANKTGKETIENERDVKRQQEDTKLFSQQLAKLDEQSKQFKQMLELMAANNDMLEKQNRILVEPDKRVGRAIASEPVKFTSYTSVLG